MKPVACLLFLVVAAGAQSASKQEDIDSLIRVLRGDPANVGAIQGLVKHEDDPRVLAALHDAFIQNTQTGATTTVGTSKVRISQVIAYSLISRGAEGNEYFEELAQYAREAIAADPPSHEFLTDASGVEQPDKGHDPAFDSWCADRGLDTNACLSRIVSYVLDVNYIIAAHDARAIPIWRSALAGSNAGIVDAAVKGLAQLNDTDSLPLIAQTCSRFPPHDAQVIATFATSYRTPAVLQLFERFIKDPDMRAQAEKDWKINRKPVAEVK